MGVRRDSLWTLGVGRGVISALGGDSRTFEVMSFYKGAIGMLGSTIGVLSTLVCGMCALGLMGIATGLF